jgi:hypothetical protein
LLDTDITNTRARRSADRMTNPLDAAAAAYTVAANGTDR